tara:strand:- start:18 stop:1055 length:1038 start_codon:yes stop_codon:yes gene_type:complete
MRILVTGGAGFIGSHIAEFYAEKGNDITVYDNLSRAALLNKEDKHSMYNWNHLTKFKNVKLMKEEIVNEKELEENAKGADVIFHTAAQTAVTSSLTDPRRDFMINSLGTFNVLEAARKNDVNTVVYTSTNKVYGDNVNKVKIKEGDLKYSFDDERYANGLPEDFGIDLCEHTPYGCSKLSGDLYMQDYGHLYGMKVGVFRCSCIYGTRQFGVEDQGWISWFIKSTLLGKPLTIYGDGKQVRDVLYVTDLVGLFDKFVNSNLKHEVFNAGGGVNNTLSLLQLLDILKELTNKKSEISFKDWRPSDQKVYVSDTSKANRLLNWEQKVSPKEGIKKLVDWAVENKDIF